MHNHPAQRLTICGRPAIGLGALVMETTIGAPVPGSSLRSLVTFGHPDTGVGAMAVYMSSTPVTGVPR